MYFFEKKREYVKINDNDQEIELIFEYDRNEKVWWWNISKCNYDKILVKTATIAASILKKLNKDVQNDKKTNNKKNEVIKQ